MVAKNEIQNLFHNNINCDLLSGYGKTNFGVFVVHETQMEIWDICVRYQLI